MSEKAPDTAEYDLVAIERATVLSVVPYTDGPEYHEYTVDAEELPTLLQNIDDPEVAESLISVDVVRE